MQIWGRPFCVAVIVLAGAWMPAAHAAEPSDAAPLKADELLAFCGDSITSSGLYPLYVEAYVRACAGQPQARFGNYGRWGERAVQFPKQMDNGVLKAKPAVATICYGMNSCRSGRVMGEQAAASWGASGIRTIIQKLKASGTRLIVLASPGCVDSTHFTLAQSKPPEPGPIKATQTNLSLLRDAAKVVAAEEQVIFADMHTPMVEVMAKAKAKHGAGFAFAGGGGDGVHPNAAGHLVMTWVMLKALGYDGEIGTIEADLTAQKAQAADGHAVQAMKDGVIELESTRYVFCTGGDPASWKSTRSVADLFPFHQDLNRFVLKVRGAGGKPVKVTWGAASKTFDAAALEKGINLAEAFPDNPFGKRFMQVVEGLAERNRCAKWLRTSHKGDAGMQKRYEKALAQIEITPLKHTIRLDVQP